MNTFRPAGAFVGGAPTFYTPIAPLGLKPLSPRDLKSAMCIQTTSYVKYNITNQYFFQTARPYKKICTRYLFMLYLTNNMILELSLYV